LKDLNWTFDDMIQNGNIRFVTYKYNINFKINITIIISEVIGKLNVGYSIITPKSIKTVIEIRDYKYQNQNNRLSLTLGAVSGKFSFKTNPSDTIGYSGIQRSEIYLSFSKSSFINGIRKDIKFSNTETFDLNAIDNIELVEQSKSKFKDAIQYQLVTIDFSPNASYIVYDPTIGYGSPPDDQICPIDPNERIVGGYIVGGILVVGIIIIAVIIILYSRKKNLSYNVV